MDITIIHCWWSSSDALCTAHSQVKSTSLYRLLSLSLSVCLSVRLCLCLAVNLLHSCVASSRYSFFFILTSSFLFHCQSSSYPISYVASSRFWLSILSSRTASLTHCLPDFPILSFSCLCVRAIIYPLLTPFLTFSVSLSVLLPFVWRTRSKELRSLSIFPDLVSLITSNPL